MIRRGVKKAFRPISRIHSHRFPVLSVLSTLREIVTTEERNQLVSSTLWSQSQGDGVQSLDGVETKADIVVTELIYQDRNRVQLFAFGIHDRRDSYEVGQ